MGTTAHDLFAGTLQQTQGWLKQLEEALDCDAQGAYAGLRSTLHALRDRVPPDEAVHLGAQLPMLVRGFYYDGWKPSRSPRHERHKEEFLEHIARDLRADVREVDAEAIARAVFQLLALRISEGEIANVVHLLPAEIRELWPEGVHEPLHPVG